MRKFTYYGSFASAAYFTDLFGIPDAAYSLRKLSPNSVYSGAAIRVRRSSDNTEQDINFVSSAVDAPLDTAALLSFVGAGDGFVTAWYNQNGSANHAIQTSAVSQPLIVNTGVLLTLSGVPRMDFDGNNDFLSLTSTINFAASNYQSFVGKRNASPRRLMALAGFQYLLALWSDNKYYLQANTSGYVESNATDTTTSHLIITGLTESLGTQRIYKNNIEVASSFVSFNLGTGISAIGRYANGNFFTFGEMQETIYYNIDKSADRSAIETNINNYYNVF